MRDVLIFTPVLRLEAATVQALMAQEWDGPLSLLMQRDNPTGDAKMDHLHQYQRGRETFLRGSYEGLLVIESDIIPPANALQQLAALDCDVAYGCYVFRGKDSQVVNVFERYPGQARNTGESLTVHEGLWAAACRQGVVDCSGGGLGCVLIRRHVLEALPFRMDPDPGSYPVHCDTYWTRDVYAAGFSMKASTLVICGHIREDGQVLWPEMPA